MTTKKPKVLVIEDDEIISYILEFMLTKEDFDVEIINDGQSALNHIVSQTENTPADLPGVILLDVMLPYVNGHQLLSEIRSSETWRDIPVLMLTSKALESNIAQGLAAGASDYIVKPFTPTDVVERIRKYLPADTPVS